MYRKGQIATNAKLQPPAGANHRGGKKHKPDTSRRKKRKATNQKANNLVCMEAVAFIALRLISLTIDFGRVHSLFTISFISKMPLKRRRDGAERAKCRVKLLPMYQVKERPCFFS